MDRVELFRAVTAMAAVDGNLADEEAGLLAARAVQWGISKPEIAAALRNATSGKVQIQIPSSRSDRHEMLREMMRMMAVDGRIDKREMALCAAVAAAMKISPAELERIVNSL